MHSWVERFQWVHVFATVFCTRNVLFLYQFYYSVSVMEYVQCSWPHYEVLDRTGVFLNFLFIEISCINFSVCVQFLLPIIVTYLESRPWLRLTECRVQLLCFQGWIKLNIWCSVSTIIRFNPTSQTHYSFKQIVRAILTGTKAEWSITAVADTQTHYFHGLIQRLAYVRTSCFFLLRLCCPKLRIKMW